MAVLYDDAIPHYYEYGSTFGITPPFTMAIWFNLNETPAREYNLFQIGDTATSNNYYRLLLGDDGTPTTWPVSVWSSGLNGSSTAADYANSTAVITQGVWQHACGIYAGNSDRRAFLNGGNEGTNTNTVSTPAGLDSLSIGYENDTTPGDSFTGGLMWPAIWNVALNADEILQLAKGAHPTTIRPNQLVFFQPMERPDSSAPNWIDGTTRTANGGSPTYTEGPFVRNEAGILVPQYEEEQGIYYVGGAADGLLAPAATSGSVTHGLDIQEGDVIVAAIHVNGAANTISDNNGANTFTADAYADSLDHTDATSTLSIYTRVASASEPASYSWSWSTAGEWSIALKVFRGVDTSNHPTSIWEVAPSASTFTSTPNTAETLNAANITIGRDECVALMIGGSDSDPWTTPSLDTSYETRVTVEDGRPVHMWQRRHPRGATGTPTFNWTGNNDFWSFHVALRNAPDPRPYFVGGATNTAAAADTISVTHGVDIQAGDVVIAAVHSNEVSVTILDNNGANSFTSDFQEQNPSAGTGTTAFFSRVAGASEPASYSFNYTGPTDRISLNIAVFRNVKNEDIWHVAPSAVTRAFQATGTVANTPLINTTADNVMGIATFMEDSGRRFASPTRGYGNEVESDPNDQANALYSNLLAKRGTWEVVEATATGTLSGSVNHQLALNPAPTTAHFFVSAATEYVASGTSITVTHGLDIQADDVLIAILHHGSAGTISSTGGLFTSTFTEENPTAETSQIAFFERVATASEGSSFTFTSAGTANRFSCHLLLFRGINTTTIWDVEPSASTRQTVTPGTTLATPVALTTIGDNTIGIGYATTDNDGVLFSDYTVGQFEVEHGSGQGAATVTEVYETAGAKTAFNAIASQSQNLIMYHFSLLAANVTAPIITDVANSGETPGAGSESWQDGSTGNVISGSNFV